MPEPRFDEVVHPPTRLRICGLLRPLEEMDFAVLRDTLGVSDATLSKQLKILTEAGYVRLAKTTSPARRDARRITWVALTPAGRKSFDSHVLALQEIAGAAHVRPD
ncbi:MULTISPECIES: transcriptional regulator [unclassified Arthrobacter]|uniref:transcriptional regulator n=1 Tax=unclassified Arthrobacter TaxID=235627 RepID=UPI001D133FDA|nr:MULTISPECIES: transcriptional regulator [unclassified Arthrobacter]MCC3290988.1 transcriptional regulator [Arthrobacter sp. zg-Y1110]MCC3301612.1 transcriptional regulator [Arthrobacter sp. zg-Y895]UWX86399.1 transcriptional regulator [Arthrobacter sp. zg-Y1110]